MYNQSYLLANTSATPRTPPPPQTKRIRFAILLYLALEIGLIFYFQTLKMKTSKFIMSPPECSCFS